MAEFDEEFDFVVVGSGGGSMCAALVLREQGKRVLILEKTSLLGGTTARSGGVMWIPNNRFMKRDGVPDSTEQALAYMEATAGTSADAPGSTPERRKAYVVAAPRMVDFLVERGIRLDRVKHWPDYYDEREGGSAPGRTVIAEMFDLNELGEWKDRLRPNFMPVPAKPDEASEVSTLKSSWRGKAAMLKVGLRMGLAKLTGKRWTVSGGALQGRMLQAAVKAGVEFRTDSAVRHFIVEDGAVKGVVVAGNGNERRIAARLGVLVNAGGFSQNQAMRDRYAPGTSVEWTAAAPGDTGEIIEEMMAVGAAVGQMNERVGNQMSIPPGRENKSGEGVDLMSLAGQPNFTKPYSIVVDQSGVRYMNEAGSYMTFCQNMLARNETVPAVPSWWVFDQNYLDHYMAYGAMAGGKLADELFTSGFLRRADTIGALAPQIGIEPAVLERTVARFNDGARQGRDDDFGRGERAYDAYLGDKYHQPSPALGPIEKAPFYAAPIVPGDVGTYGGVVTDVHARVLRADGTPIAGLYATGTSTASVMGRCYPGAGSSVGPSFVWGFLAAEHAAGLNRPA